MHERDHDGRIVVVQTHPLCDDLRQFGARFRVIEPVSGHALSDVVEQRGAAATGQDGSRGQRAVRHEQPFP